MISVQRYFVLLWLLGACLKKQGGSITFYEADDTGDQMVLIPSSLWLGDFPEDGVTVRLVPSEVAGNA
jgi:hypothetical protein